jgi:hypothetical protein
MLKVVVAQVGSVLFDTEKIEAALVDSTEPEIRE